jgi:hypothetical protein
MRKTPPYWREAAPEALPEAPEGSADQPTPEKDNETNTTITNHVNPLFKKVLLLEYWDCAIFSSFQSYLVF